MSYSKVTLYGRQTIDYLVVNKSNATDDEIEITNVPEYVPDWKDFENPEIINQFNYNNVSTVISNLVNPLKSYIIYRQKVGDSKINKVAEIPKEQLSILDYLVKNNTEYKWTVVPATETEIGSVIMSDIVKTNFQYWYITSIEEVKSNIYIAKETWRLGLNLSAESLVQNIDKTQMLGYSKYPKYSIGKQNFKSSSISCLIGDVECETKKYNEDFEKIEAWNEFVASGNDCILKDIKGRIFKCQIENSSEDDDEKIQQLPTSISFNYTEIGAIEDITVNNGENI